MVNDVIVSVMMTTYKHESYLKEAIEGVLMQIVDFHLELVIADDCSPDFTENIVKDIIDRHPNGRWIKYFRHNTNLGMHKNAIFAFNKCEGKYIAFCEGDDYWSDQNKLQKQVDFLETNRDFVLCFHNSNILIKGTMEEDYFKKKNIPEVSSYYDLLCFGNFMQTSSVVFYNKIKSFPFEKGIQLNDYILWFWISQFGKIYRFNESMSVYRIGSGVWSTLDSYKQIIHTVNYLHEAMKIVKNESDVIILDNRIKSLNLSLLPIQLQKKNNTHYDLKEFLSKNINISVLLLSALNKVLDKIFRVK
jgi:glycosyltransferase involved in cell wall biosynthesis